MQIEEKPLVCKQLVVKIASRCNLNCTYCYMYNAGDTTYLSQPKFMSAKTVDALLLRIKNHCQKHNIRSFSIVFHGGEPTLAGKKFFNTFYEKTQKILFSEGIGVAFAIQTNAISITDEWCDVLGKMNFSVGVSIDGTREANDAYRVDHHNKGSYDRIVNGITKIAKHPVLGQKYGLLTVINIDSDPLEVYDHLLSLQPRSLNFLLPEYTFDNYPYLNTDETPYGDWLIKIFDRWFDQKDSKVRIRLFKDVINIILGGSASTDALGGGDNTILVIETNGAIEAVDILRVCGNGFTRNDLNVNTTEFDDTFKNDLAKMYHLSHKILAKKCMACPVKEICGAGYLPSRYSSKNGFNNPSIYCRDLLKLITHIQNRVVDSLPENVKVQTGVEPLLYQEALNIIEQKLPSIPDTGFEELMESFKQAPKEELV